MKDSTTCCSRCPYVALPLNYTTYVDTLVYSWGAGGPQHGVEPSSFFEGTPLLVVLKESQKEHHLFLGAGIRGSRKRHAQLEP